MSVSLNVLVRVQSREAQLEAVEFACGRHSTTYKRHIDLLQGPSVVIDVAGLRRRLNAVHSIYELANR